jgi:predicted transcriptional regulator
MPKVPSELTGREPPRTARDEAPPGVTVDARRELAMWLVGAVLAAAILVGTVVALGGRVDAATWGLVVAAAAMVFALRSLYRMATALARPPVEAVLDELDVAAYAGRRELREERRRLLRAINELQFDYEMGKLSSEDYRKVRQGYELQAVEVIRALDAESELHPRLAEELRRRGLVTEAEAKPAEAKAAVEAEAKPSEAAAVPEPVPESETTKPDPVVPTPASSEEASA